MNKDIKTEIAIGIILIVAIIVGGLIWLGTKDTNGIKNNSPKIEVPVMPVNDTEKVTACTEDLDCAIAYTGSEACWPCEADANNKDFECLSRTEAEKIFNQRVEDKVQGWCEVCLKTNYTFGCSCQKGACTKIEKNVSKNTSENVLKQNPQVSNINNSTVYSYKPKYGELKGFSVTYQTDKWSLDDEESGAAMGMLFSKVNNNCAVLLNAGGHGMPLDLTTKDEEVKIGENTAGKRTWFDEKGGIVLVAVTFGENSTPYIFEFKPQLAVNQKSCIDGIMKVLATFKYLP